MFVCEYSVIILMAVHGDIFLLLIVNKKVAASVRFEVLAVGKMRVGHLGCD
jgi:hypothetical protein